MIVDVELTNRWARVRSKDPKAIQLLYDYWAFMPKSAFWTPSHKLWLRERQRAIEDGEPDRKIVGWDGFIRLLKRGRVSAGLFRATRREIEAEHGVEFRVTCLTPKPKDLDCTPIVAAGDKYDYQTDCVNRMLKAIRRGGGIVLSATGTGKTAISGSFFKAIPYHCLFVVDQINLLYQAQAEIGKWLGEKVGCVGNTRYEVERVTVGTIQTLHRHSRDPIFQDWFSRVEIVLVDELHDQLSRRNFDLLEEIKPRARYGLTATLQLKQKPVRIKAYAFAGPVLFEFPITEGIEAGVLSDGKVIQILFPEATEDYTDYWDEYKVNVIEDTLKIKALLEIVDLLLKENRSVLVLAWKVKHVEMLHGLLQNRNIRHRVAYGKIDNRRRVRSQEKFEAGDIRLIVANQVMQKGVDLKRVDAIIDVAELKSKNNAIQKFGRGVRLHEDKTDLLYIDMGTASGRFKRNAVSRRRAFVAQQVSVTVTSVCTAGEAVAFVKLHI